MTPFIVMTASSILYESHDFISLLIILKDLVWFDKVIYTLQELIVFNIIAIFFILNDNNIFGTTSGHTVMALNIYLNLLTLLVLIN